LTKHKHCVIMLIQSLRCTLVSGETERRHHEDQRKVEHIKLRQLGKPDPTYTCPIPTTRKCMQTFTRATVAHDPIYICHHCWKHMYSIIFQIARYTVGLYAAYHTFICFLFIECHANAVRELSSTSLQRKCLSVGKTSVPQVNSAANASFHFQLAPLKINFPIRHRCATTQCFKMLTYSIILD
jgi:hypothetical protein